MMTKMQQVMMELARVTGLSQLPAQMRKNCKDIKDNNADAKSGLYLVRIEGNNQYS